MTLNDLSEVTRRPPQQQQRPYYALLKQPNQSSGRGVIHAVKPGKRLTRARRRDGGVLFLAPRG